MHRPIRHHEAEQLNLLHEARQSPTWQRLPAEVRERTVALLARLLHEHQVHRPGGDAAQEAGDE